MHYLDVILKGACDGLDFERECEDTETICEAVFNTNYGSCNIHCKSLGLVCEGGWNNGEGCNKEWGSPNRCDKEYGDQICRCKKG